MEEDSVLALADSESKDSVTLRSASAYCTMPRSSHVTELGMIRPPSK